MEPSGALTNDQRAALLGLLTEIPADSWSALTACRGWPVHDVVAHLVEGELLFGRVYRGELKALTREDADPQAGVARWTHADGETLRYSLWHHGSATQRVIDSRSESSWDRPVPVFEWPGRLRDVLGLHFFDLALHSHDVASALGAASLWGDRIPAIVGYVLGAAPAVLGRSAGIAAEALTVEVDGAGRWTLAHGEDGWTVVEGGSAPRWITDPVTLVEATTGRASPSDALERTKLEGDAGPVGELIAAWQLKSG